MKRSTLQQHREVVMLCEEGVIIAIMPQNCDYKDEEVNTTTT
jgi:hypothetical protein